MARLTRVTVNARAQRAISVARVSRDAYQAHFGQGQAARFVGRSVFKFTMVQRARALMVTVEAHVQQLANLASTGIKASARLAVITGSDTMVQSVSARQATATLRANSCVKAPSFGPVLRA